MADSEEKLCRLVSEFVRVCERRELRVNVPTFTLNSLLSHILPNSLTSLHNFSSESATSAVSSANNSLFISNLPPWGKSKVARCSRCGNGGQMHVILNGAPTEEVDCFKYLGSQVAADRGCKRMWYTE